MHEVTAPEIVDALQRTPLLTVSQVRSALDREPDTRGTYAWWLTTPEELPSVPATPHPSEPVGLLYVGIGPDSENSKRKLRDRFNDHTKRNTGNSTLRLILAGLLFEWKRWEPFWTDRPMLEKPDNDALSAWQEAHLLVQWVEVPEPWLLEAEVIGLMRPPLNRKHNAAHPFYKEAGDARDRFRQAAQQNPRRTAQDGTTDAATGLQIPTGRQGLKRMRIEVVATLPLDGADLDAWKRRGDRREFVQADDDTVVVTARYGVDADDEEAGKAQAAVQFGRDGFDAGLPPPISTRCHVL